MLTIQKVKTSNYYYPEYTSKNKKFGGRIEYTTKLFLSHELAHAIRDQILHLEIYQNTSLENEKPEATYREEYETWLLAKSYLKPKYWNAKKAQFYLDEYYSICDGRTKRLIL